MCVEEFDIRPDKPRIDTFVVVDEGHVRRRSFRDPPVAGIGNPGPVSVTMRRLSAGYRAAKAANRAGVSSVELLFTTTHSHSPAGMSCRTTDSSAARSCPARLCVGIMSERRIIVRM